MNVNDLDDILIRLGGAPVHPCLAVIDGAVLAGVAHNGAAAGRTIARSFGVTALIALGMGLAGAALPGLPVNTAPPISPFGVAPALAPSTLLGIAE